MTTLMIALAFLNGFLIVTTRVVNARLGEYVSSVGAAIWNHFVGFLFLALIIPFFTDRFAVNGSDIPLYLFLGGIIGAGYVAISNSVIPEIGATKATILVVAGQIIVGTIIDVATGKVSNLSVTIVGITFVLLGMQVGNRRKRHGSI